MADEQHTIIETVFPEAEPETVTAAVAEASPSVIDIAPTITETTLNLKDAVHDLSDIVAEITGDWKGFGISDVIRIVPQLAAHVQKLSVAGPEKYALVLAAVHLLVDRMPDAAQSSAHALVDAILPAVIKNVLDVAKGRVSLQTAAVAAAALPAVALSALPALPAEVAAGCFAFLPRCFRK